ncbi:MAG: SLBB domain-containing protein [Cyclobacteriaceae bacterium]
MSNLFVRCSKTFALFIFILFSFLGHSQSREDLKNIKVDELSDAQIEQMLKRAQEMGYSEQDIFMIAQAEGVSVTESTKLSQRINTIKANKLADENEKQQSSEPVVKKSQPRKVNESNRRDPFGYALFNENTRTLSFETNLRIPTPDDYILGPGDQLGINIYGASERNYSQSIDNQGNILIQNVGPVHVSGLTLTRARTVIKGRLSNVYKDLLSADPSTFIQTSVTSVRPIKVNIIGEVKMPGTYTVNGLATVVNSLYVAGGPTLMGTLREIKVFRKNRHIASVDIYKFLMDGEIKPNIRLQNDDIIMVGSYLERVMVKGEVKRSGLFELKDGESLEDLIKYAGGFTPNAYTAKISLERNGERDKLVADVYQEQFGLFEAKAGDVYTIGAILNRFQNRVIIRGAVYRPGPYAFSEGLSLTDLINKADGLRGEAFQNRILITRTNQDLSTSLISFSLNDLESGEIEDLKLQPEDVVTILSKFEIEEERIVKISGEVNSPGSYRFHKGMNIEDLVLIADGVRSSAKDGSVEIARIPEDQSRTSQTEIFTLNIDNRLAINDESFELKPFDHVIVRRDDSYFEQKSVELVGQIAYPGIYAVQSAEERISDFVRRSGGLTQDAYPKGAVLIRRTEFFETDGVRSNRKSSLLNVLLSQDSMLVTESDIVFRNSVEDELSSTQFSASNESIASIAKKERLNELASKNTFLSDLKIKESEAIPLDLERIMKGAGTAIDLVIEDGDIISIPKRQSTVRLRGRVLYPNTVSFEAAKGAKSYINQGGGFDSRARKSRTYVVYANGSVARTKGLWFIRKYPKIEPGSEIIVPVKPLKMPIKVGELATVTTSLAAVASIIISQITK